MKRRYTTTDGVDWIVTISWDEGKLDRAHWFEAAVDAVQEGTRRHYAFPREIRTFRIGEAEHPFRYWCDRDFDGDREACVNHLLGTISRRVYDYIERGH